MATVVVTFASTPSTSSTPPLSTVTYSSVSSGWISLTAPTRVVLPTPKPPAMRIFSATGRTAPSGSEGSKTIKNRLEYALVGNLCGRHRGARADEPTVEQVAEQDPDGADREVEFRGDLRDRHRALAEPDDRGVLGQQPGVGAPHRPGGDD